MMTTEMRKKPVETIDQLYDRKYSFVADFNEYDYMRTELFLKYGSDNFKQSELFNKYKQFDEHLR